MTVQNSNLTTRKTAAKEIQPAPQNNATVEVLYQKMGDRWFAFSLVNDEVFVGSISQEQIDSLESGAQKVHSITGNT
jgi:hypothetical protein